MITIHGEKGASVPEIKKVLIAEDEAPLREVLCERLSEESGIEVIPASDGYEAIQKLEEFLPDLALLDIAMPKKSGLSVYQDLKESEWGKRIQVMFLTNSSGMSDVSFAQKYGPVDYLVKADWGIEDLVAKIRKKLEI
jgi:two-component system response regulator VicR